MSDISAAPESALAHTPLHDLHCALGAQMRPFAGYLMPVQYPTGIIAEHLHTRAAAGLFDASHMGLAILAGPGAGRRLETLAPGDIDGLPPGRMRYTQLLDPDGHILDDLMVTRLADEAGRERLFLVVNAGVNASLAIQHDSIATRSWDLAPRRHSCPSSLTAHRSRVRDPCAAPRAGVMATSRSTPAIRFRCSRTSEAFHDACATGEACWRSHPPHPPGRA